MRRVFVMLGHSRFYLEVLLQNTETVGNTGTSQSWVRPKVRKIYSRDRSPWDCLCDPRFSWCICSPRVGPSQNLISFSRWKQTTHTNTMIEFFLTVYSPSLIRYQVEIHVVTFRRTKFKLTVHRGERRQNDERRHSDLYSRVEPVIFSDLVGLSHLTVKWLSSLLVFASSYPLQ